MAILVTGCTNAPSPTTAEDWNLKGDELSEQQDWSGALQAYNQSIQLDPTNAYTWDHLSVCYNHMDKNEEALDACNHALQIKPNDTGYLFQKSHILSRLGRMAESEEIVQKIIEIDTGTTFSPSEEAMNRGFSLLMEKNLKGALDAYNNATQLDPTNALAWRYKGNCLFSLKRYDEALSSYDKAYQLDTPRELNSKILSDEGDCYIEMGEYDKALNLYKQALMNSHNPDEGSKAMAGIVKSLHSLGKLDEENEAKQRIISTGDYLDGQYVGKTGSQY